MRELNLKFESKLQNYDEAKDQITSLKAQVEDFQEQLDRKKEDERNWSDEMTKLKCSVEKQAREKRRLYLEKEQLQWKIKETTPMKRFVPGNEQLQWKIKETTPMKRFVPG